MSKEKQNLNTEQHDPRKWSVEANGYSKHYGELGLGLLTAAMIVGGLLLLGTSFIAGIAVLAGAIVPALGAYGLNYGKQYEVQKSGTEKVANKVDEVAQQVERMADNMEKSLKMKEDKEFRGYNKRDYMDFATRTERPGFGRGGPEG